VPYPELSFLMCTIPYVVAEQARATTTANLALMKLGESWSSCSSSTYIRRQNPWWLRRFGERKADASPPASS